jgi:hypothetical protein
MNTKRRLRPAHSTVVAYLALFVALGGTTYAATNLPLPKNSVGTRQLKDHAVTSSKLNPTAVILRAMSATEAQRAALAGNADNLGGSPASSFRLHCPSGLMASGDLCFDGQERSPATLEAALSTCALAQMRLPTAGELALLFNSLGAPQDGQLVADWYTVGTTVEDPILSEDSSRSLSLGVVPDGNLLPYRCVTSPSN